MFLVAAMLLCGAALQAADRILAAGRLKAGLRPRLAARQLKQLMAAFQARL